MPHHQVRDVMTPNPITLPVTATAVDAAKKMREEDVGDVVVVEDSRIRGIVTDRDLVVRSLAVGQDPAKTKLGDICSRELTIVCPTDAVADAISLMKDKAIRRLPVVENGRPVGIVSLGDLAVERDRHSALGEISAAPANH
jgi:CBS domain-containing protein